MRVCIKRKFCFPKGDGLFDLPGVKALLDDGTMRVRSGMAYFSTDLRGRCLPVREEDTAKEMLECIELLRMAMDSVHSQGVSVCKPKVGIAGSAALCSVERMMSTDREGKMRGRWKDAVACGKNPCWSPNDVDVFVCGRAGRRKAAFRSVVRTIQTRMQKVLTRKGKKLIVEEEFEHNYTSRTSVFLIRNMRVEGMSMAISFIQVPEALHVGEVVEQFDLDIVKAVCNVHEKVVSMPVEVASKIWLGKAEVMDFVTQRCFPNTIEEKAIVSTMKRMRKFGGRGYRFGRYFSIRSATTEAWRKKMAASGGVARGGVEVKNERALPISESEEE